MGLYIFLTSHATSKSYLALAFAILSAAGGLGTAANLVLTPRLVQWHGIIMAVWIITAVAMSAVAAGFCFFLMRWSYLEIEEVDGEEETTGLGVAQAIGAMPTAYWQLLAAAVCFTSAASAFAMSVQRFLAIYYFGGSQSQAGSAARYVGMHYWFRSLLTLNPHLQHHICPVQQFGHTSRHAFGAAVVPYLVCTDRLQRANVVGASWLPGTFHRLARSLMYAGNGARLMEDRFRTSTCSIAPKWHGNLCAACPLTLGRLDSRNERTKQCKWQR